MMLQRWGNSTVFNVKLIKDFARHQLKISLQELSKTMDMVYLVSKTLIIYKIATSKQLVQKITKTNVYEMHL